MLKASRRRKKVWGIIAVWVLVALGMLLAPAPREWGVFGKWISPHYDRIQPILQPAVHVVLMAVFSGLLMLCFTHRALHISLLYSLGLAFALAVAFEMMQSILPVAFARRCDVADLVPAFCGALVGCMVGVFLRPGRERGVSPLNPKL